MFHADSLLAASPPVGLDGETNDDADGAQLWIGDSLWLADGQEDG
jgi:hypothetical protein